MKKYFFPAWFAGFLLCLFCAAGGDYAVTLDARGAGIAYWTDLSLFSRLIVTEPPWGKEHYFYSWTTPTTVTRNELPGGACRLTMKPLRENEVFRLEEYSAEVQPDRVIIRVEGELLREEPVLVEYSMLMIPVLLMRGATFDGIRADGRPIEGKIPPEIQPYPVKLAENLRTLNLHSELGELQINVKHGVPFDLSDRRGYGFDVNSETATQGLLVIKQSEVEAGERYSHELEVSFRPSPGLRLASPLEPQSAEALPAQPEKALVTVPERRPPLLPGPKQWTKTAGVYRPASGDGLRLFGDGQTTEERRKLARAAERILVRDLGLPLSAGGRGGVEIHLTDRPVAGLTAPEQPEGYALRVGEDGVIVVSRSDRGAFYGLQTLRKLYRDGGFPGAEIVDWPDLAWRGVLIMVDEHSPRVHGELIEKVLAPMHFNQLYIECEYAAWDATAAVRQPWAIGKEELRKLVELAEENYLEVIPLFQTLGHCEWLFKGGRNLEMAEDPARPNVYDPSHPGVYPLMEAALEEVLDVFGQPKFLHIGHDEVGQEYAYPTRPHNIAKGGAQVILDDVKFYYDFCRKHDLRMMMWQDMFVASYYTEDGKRDDGFFGLGKRLEELPKDIVFAFWNYETTIKEENMSKLRRLGFDVVGSTWFGRENNRVMAEACRRTGALGIMVTTWAGYHGFDRLYEEAFEQVAGYLYGGARSWNLAPEANDFAGGEVLYDLLQLPPDPAAPGVTFDLSGVANLALNADNRPFLLDPILGFDRLLKVDPSGCNVKFHLSERDGQPAAVALRSRCNPPFPETSGAIPVGRRIGKFFWLHTFRDLGRNIAAGTPVAEYVICYEDGETVTLPVRYRREIGLPTEDCNLFLPPAHALQWPADGETVRCWYMSWENPHPEKAVQSFELRAVPDHYPFYLLAVSAADAPGR